MTTVPGSENCALGVGAKLKSYTKLAVVVNPIEWTWLIDCEVAVIEIVFASLAKAVEGIAVVITKLAAANGANVIEAGTMLYGQLCPIDVNE